MKQLHETFTFDHFDFRQLQRSGRVALFAKTKPGHTRETYEVVIIQHIKARQFRNCFTEAHEAMPSPSQWGMAGWTFSDPAKAIAKFNKLANHTKTVIRASS